ncbi:SIMPL domain-containing protein [Gluconobacter japonicus]|uniref:SIMPL domain-containing protein n=1 Tax=Gluconobacter japonicus TaxID=376620 RepID=UPI0024AD0A5C|nr:SIMPL domain-containing protein [Gluconobacter japonicus]MDI6652347.1 SIMPL domain-containing protein [Gluconobacter japonicus]
MKRLFRLVTPLAVLSLAAFCQARAEDSPNGTQLDFTVTGEAHAAPTLLTVRLFGRADSTSAIEAQKTLNAHMADAMKMASGQVGIEAQAGSYSLSDQTPERGPTRWMARQDLSLSGKEAVALLDLSGKLQSHGLMMDGLEWSLDSDTRETLLAQARTQALQKVRKEAEESARTLGLHVVRLKQVRVSSMEPGPRPVMLMAARASGDSFTPPQGTPQEQTLRVTVSVQAELAP